MVIFLYIRQKDNVSLFYLQKLYIFRFYLNRHGNKTGDFDDHTLAMRTSHCEQTSLQAIYHASHYTYLSPEHIRRYFSGKIIMWCFSRLNSTYKTFHINIAHRHGIINRMTCTISVL